MGRKTIWIAAVALVAFGLFGLAAKPPQPLDPAIPPVPRGGTFVREWPKAEAPNFETLERRLGTEGRIVGMGDYADGGYANDYEMGPYQVSIGQRVIPNRVTIEVHRSWWPLW